MLSAGLRCKHYVLHCPAHSKDRIPVLVAAVMPQNYTDSVGGTALDSYSDASQRLCAVSSDKDLYCSTDHQVGATKGAHCTETDKQSCPKLMGERNPGAAGDQGGCGAGPGVTLACV